MRESQSMNEVISQEEYNGAHVQNLLKNVVITELLTLWQTPWMDIWAGERLDFELVGREQA